MLCGFLLGAKGVAKGQHSGAEIDCLSYLVKYLHAYVLYCRNAIGTLVE